ncbi:MAG: YqiA/YcfP family alpha/beta fold hydrolase [Capnocytophaga sp.]|nr:YqiA/YcfP family alpha/beta fold hydrolase [Capnocytophaga sp.]
MKILYLHGLDSFLQNDRKEVLEQYGTVYAPILDYKNTPDLFQILQKDYAHIQAIIGSSAGGLIAYFLAQFLQKPCLLFNPALTFKHQMPISITFNPKYEEYMQIVIGGQDEVIQGWQSLAIIQNDISENQNITIHFVNKMKHSYNIDIFGKEVDFFFNELKIKKLS